MWKEPCMGASKLTIRERYEVYLSRCPLTPTMQANLHAARVRRQELLVRAEYLINHRSFTEQDDG